MSFQIPLTLRPHSASTLAGVREANYSSVADGPGNVGAMGEQTDSAPSADTRLLKSLSAQGHLAGDRLLALR